MAQPFDPAKAKTTGDAVPLAEPVDYLSGVGQGFFSSSRNGTLVYTWGAFGGGKRQLTWFDRGGKSIGTVGMPAATVWDLAFAGWLDCGRRPDGCPRFAGHLVARPVAGHGLTLHLRPQGEL